MVKAYLAGRKFQTRRMRGLAAINHLPDQWLLSSIPEVDKDDFFILESSNGHNIKLKSPFGKKGDVLWVRENFCPTNSIEYLNEVTGLPYFYQADVKDIETSKEVMKEYGWKWKPSIHMPMDVCRIFLEVVNVRLERLFDISDSDAILEGIESVEHHETNKKVYRDYTYYSDKAMSVSGFLEKPSESFLSLFASIHGIDKKPRNPWVWVIEFKKIDNIKTYFNEHSPN